MKNQKLLHGLIISIIGFSQPVASAAESIQQLKAKLEQATLEIEALKARLVQSQSAIEAARYGGSVTPPTPSASLLDAPQPLLTAYELAALASDESLSLKSKLKGKVVSVTGTVARFSDGVGRSFKVILRADGTNRDVVCKFYSPTDIVSTHTEDDGADMVLEKQRGSVILASVNDDVIVSGYFGEQTRTQVTLTDCVLRKK